MRTLTDDGGVAWTVTEAYEDLAEFLRVAVARRGRQP